VQLDRSNLREMAVGCSVLGAGGGGDTAVGLLAAQQAVDDLGPVALVDLDDLPEDALVMPCGGIGAPLIWIEKIDAGDEISRVIPVVERLHGARVAALMSAEIGGSNGMSPVVWCARAGLPLLDADGMGRAFPEVPQVTMEVAGISPNPAVMTDERGNIVIFEGIDGHWMERMERAAAVEFGGQAYSSEYQMTVAQAKTATARGTVSLAIRIGAAVLGADHDPIESLIEAVGAVALIEGKIVDVERRVTGGFVRGSAAIEGIGVGSDRLLRLEIQNENLVALEDGNVLASVPDLITLLDDASADAIATELVRYGQRVVCIAFACDPIWRSPRGIELAGPRAFGYDFDYVTIEERRASRA
jgi:uncharacterized protein